MRGHRGISNLAVPPRGAVIGRDVTRTPANQWSHLRGPIVRGGKTGGGWRVAAARRIQTNSLLMQIRREEDVAVGGIRLHRWQMNIDRYWIFNHDSGEYRVKYFPWIMIHVNEPALSRYRLFYNWYSKINIKIGMNKDKKKNGLVARGLAADLHIWRILGMDVGAASLRHGQRNQGHETGPFWLTPGQIERNEKGRRWLAHLDFIAPRWLDQHLTAGMPPPIMNIHSIFRWKDELFLPVPYWPSPVLNPFPSALEFWRQCRSGSAPGSPSGCGTWRWFPTESVE